MIGTDTIRRHWPTMLTPLTTREWIEEVYSRRPSRPEEEALPIVLSPGRHEVRNTSESDETLVSLPDLTWADGYEDWIEAHKQEETP